MCYYKFKKTVQEGDNMFINFSNHRYENWGEKQKEAAAVWGEAKDLSFPYVSPEADERQIQETADQAVKDIMELKPDAVMCQGEFTLSYAVVKRLKEHGITVVSACSERRVTEELLGDGSSRKMSQYQFVRFREY